MPRSSPHAALPIVLAVVVTGAGCSDPTPLFGPPTGASCPPGSTLTYEGFGQPFMATYCTRCHARDRVGAERHGAPSFHDFDTIYGIRGVADHIDETTAAGPMAINTSMPFDGPQPTLDERTQLGAWLACGAPTATPSARL